MRDNIEDEYVTHIMTSWNIKSVQYTVKVWLWGIYAVSIAPSPGLFPEAKPREINMGEG